MNLRILAALVLLTLTHPVAAAEMVVDGETKESYERSIKAMMETLSDEDKEVFAKGLINLIVTKYPPAAGAEGLQILQFMAPATEAAHITLDGMTKEAILARGREIVAKNRDGASEEAHANSTSRRCLQTKVTLSDVRVVKGTLGYDIEVSVRNDLEWAIAGIRISYSVFTPGRSVPWVEDDFSLSIRGGVEPGETRAIRTNVFGIPNDAPKNLVAEAEIVDVADAEKRQLVRDVVVMGWGEEKTTKTCS